jgi:hypothetical protein
MRVRCCQLRARQIGRSAHPSSAMKNGNIRTRLKDSSQIESDLEVRFHELFDLRSTFKSGTRTHFRIFRRQLQCLSTKITRLVKRFAFTADAARWTHFRCRIANAACGGFARMYAEAMSANRQSVSSSAVMGQTSTHSCAHRRMAQCRWFAAMLRWRSLRYLNGRVGC